VCGTFCVRHAASNRRLKAGTVLIREYRGERHTVTMVPDGFVWRDVTRKSTEHNLDLEFNSLADRIPPSGCLTGLRSPSSVVGWDDVNFRSES
jgi:hypothetical protein